MSGRRSLSPVSISRFMLERKADYNAARSTNYRRQRRGIPSAMTGASADWHYRGGGDYLRLLEFARDMDRNDLVAGQAVDRAVNNTIQGGFTVDVKTPDKGLNEDFAARWKKWSETPGMCDTAGRMTFHAMERMVLRHRYVDGDMLVFPTAEDKLQLVEGHRLRTPKSTKKNVVEGILLDEFRRPVEYWLTNDDIDPTAALTKVSDVTSYPAWDEEGNPAVFMVFDPKRVSQTRGITAFAPIFDTLAMIEDINFAKLVQQQIVSFFAIIRTQPMSSTGIGNPIKGERTSELLSDGTTRSVEGIAPGMEYTGAPGEELSGFSPNVPNPEFFQHIRMELQLIAINLGLPLICFLLDAESTNFSGWRGAMDQAKIGFRWNQHTLRAQFHRNVWTWKVRRWIATDSAVRNAFSRLKENIFDHDWNLPTWPYIEPLTDARADAFRVENRLISPRRQQAERGQDWQQVAEEIVTDNTLIFDLAASAADKLNQKFPDLKLDPRELIGLIPPKAPLQDPVADDQSKPAPVKPPARSADVDLTHRLNGD